MSREDLLDRLHQQPFVPFRVVLTEGTAYEVRHPELFMIGRRSVTIGLAHNPQQTFYDHTALVDLLHVVRLEPLEVPSATGNGQGSSGS